MKAKQPHKYVFTRRQLIGAVLFGCIMVIIIVLSVCLHRIKTEQNLEETELEIVQSKAEAIESRLQQMGQYDNSYKKYEKPALQMSIFDPNTADSTTLLSEGIPHWMVRMMLNYRRKGGVYKTVEDLKKIPHISDSLYAQIAPYVQIDTLLFTNDTIPHHAFAQQWQQKKDTVLELNACDTTSLKLLRGIGTYTAVQIVRYRQKLGGYVSVEQLREIEGIEPSLLDSLYGHLTVCVDSVRPIPVNHSRLERLQRHPYITFTQAQAIYNLRRDLVHLNSIDDLKSLDAFSESDLLRLTPYLSFED